MRSTEGLMRELGGHVRRALLEHAYQMGRVGQTYTPDVVARHRAAVRRHDG